MLLHLVLLKYVVPCKDTKLRTGSHWNAPTPTCHSTQQILNTYCTRLLDYTWKLLLRVCHSYIQSCCCSYSITNQEPVRSSHRKCSAWTQRQQISGHQYQFWAADRLEPMSTRTWTSQRRTSSCSWGRNAEPRNDEQAEPHASPCSWVRHLSPLVISSDIWDTNSATGASTSC